jgi:predicted DNA binding CopG/RHH family protein
MKNKKRQLPKFANEDAEREYWSTFDLSKKVLKSDFESVSFPNLKPTSRSISIRIPDYVLLRVKEQANQLNIPYQTLMKQYIATGALKEKVLRK